MSTSDTFGTGFTGVVNGNNSEYNMNTFKVHGKTYFFHVQISKDFETKGSADSDTKPFSLQNNSIISFQYMNELNGLVITAKLVYCDRCGIVNNFMGCYYTNMAVKFYQIVDKTDGQFTASMLQGTNSFDQNFIIDNIQILDRDGPNITYEFSLVQTNWYNFCANVKTYTTYGKGETSVTDIIKQLMTDNNLKVGSSFDILKSNAKIDYITNLNDNLFSALMYLTSKLFYGEKKDESLRFLVYNDLMNCYDMLDLQQPGSFGREWIFLLAFSDKSVEGFLGDYVNFKSVSDVPKTKMFKTFANHNIIQFESGDFKNDNSIKTSQIKNYFNKSFDSMNYQPRVSSNSPGGNLTYNYYDSDWDNNSNIYRDQVNNIMGNDAFVIECIGNILRRPGNKAIMCANKKIENEIQKISDENTRNVTMNRYTQTQGLWIMSKVLNTIVPAPNDGSAQYTQKITMFRNFLNTPVMNRVDTQGVL